MGRDSGDRERIVSKLRTTRTAEANKPTDLFITEYFLYIKLYIKVRGVSRLALLKSERAANVVVTKQQQQQHQINRCRPGRKFSKL